MDLFSGSGLIPIGKGQIFPGSPLIPLFKIKQFPFNKYIFCDTNPRYISSLKKIIYEKKIISTEHVNCSNIDLQIGDSNSLVQKIFTGTKPTNWKSRSFLVFLDPFGWNIRWNSMERILQSGPVDVIFTFMTWGIKWNMAIQQSERKLIEFFGDEDWKSVDKTEIVDYYCNKIRSCGYMRKYETYTIDVSNTSGNTYNLILASQSAGAGNVFKALQKRVNAVTTDCIQAAFDVITGKSTDLSDFFT